MAGSKLSRKIRFLPFFPYGYCSKLAVAILGKDNSFATRILMDGNPDAMIAKSDQEREKALERARYLCEKGYAKDINRTCGTPAMKRSFRHITKKGLAVLIEAPDEAAREDDDEAIETSDVNGEIKVDHFRSGSLASADLRDLLLGLAGSDDPINQTHFNEALLDAVKEGRVTPLSYAINLVQNTKISLTKYSPNQQHSIWRQSNILAIFLANEHLTYLDRRQYDTGFAIDGITDDESHEIYIQKNGHTMASTTRYALVNWYKQNPGFYKITQTKPDESEWAKEEWLNTPAFYSTKELPNFDEQKTLTFEDNARGRRQIINAIHVGLAIGKKVNYVCYHGKPGEFKWLPNREKTAKTQTENAVRQMKTLCPEMRCKDTVDFALYFCSSRHQFLALFDKTKEKHKKFKKQNYITNEPYASMHAVPINDSGAFQAWCLLEWTPLETEQAIHDTLVENDPNFDYAPERNYPLRYKGKRVFSGYTMDVRKINYALEDHLDGHDFYIACFTDQIPWYKALFPGKTFL